MIKPTDITPDVVEALAWLRKGWDGDNSERAINAFNTLENAGVFAVIDESTGYAAAEEILADTTAYDITPVDPEPEPEYTDADLLHDMQIGADNAERIRIEMRQNES